MKILWIISSRWKEGGAENYLMLLRPFLEQQGHEVKILASDDRPDMPHFNDYSYCSHSGVLRGFFHTWNPSAYYTLKHILKEWKPDVVHVHTIGHGSPAVLFPLKGFPTLLTMHGPEGFMKTLRLWCFPKSYFLNGECKKENLLLIGKLRLLYHRLITDPLYAIGLRNITTVISPSTYMQKVAEKEGMKGMIIIPNGTTLFSHHPLALHELNQTIIYAGRLEHNKGVGVLLDAFSAVVKGFPKAQLLIVGDGSVREELEERVRALGMMEHVSFVGHVDRAQLEDLYARSMIAFMPSIWVEAFGLAGLEAMSVGRPVIASRVGGISDWLIDGKTGYLVEPADATAISEKIIHLFSHPALLLEMMENARKRSLDFSMKVHADRMMEAYADARSRVAKST